MTNSDRQERQPVQVTERALHESEERLRLATEAAGIGTWEWDALTDIQTADERARLIAGIPTTRPLSSDVFWEIVHPDDRERVNKAVHRAVEEHTDYSMEYRIVRLDGAVRWVLSMGRGYYDRADNPVRLIGILMDITDRKQAEEALRDSEERFRALSEAAFEGIGITRNGIIVEANQTLLDMTGYERSELIGMSALDLVMPESLETAIQHIIEGSTEPYEMSARRKNGSTIIVEVRGKSIIYQGEPARVGALLDITERKRAEDELRNTERDLNRAQTIAHIGSWRLDVQQDQLLWSDETYCMFAVPKGTKLTYEFFLSYIHPEDREYVDRKWQAALQGEPYDIEHRICVDDQIKWVRETAELEWDEEGRLQGGFGTVQDITNQKQTEDALAAERYRLEAMESVAEAGISTTELEETLYAIAERITRALGTDICTILLLEDNDELVTRAAYGIPEEYGFRIRADRGVVGKILTTRRTIYLKDAENDPLVVSSHIKKKGVKSLLGTSLIARGRALGVIYVGMLHARKFTQDESRLLQNMASRVALIAENARLYERLAKSREEVQRNFSLLQRSLLPPQKIDVGPGYRMAAAYRSPYGLEIGGDFYDVFDTAMGQHAAMIGDVAGKGVGAVSLATATRSTIRALAYDIPSPGEVLTHANSVLHPQAFVATESEFVTVCLVVIDAITGELRYSGAGHPPPMIYRGSDGVTDLLDAVNPPLRVAPGIKFKERSSYILPGDKMILYTDGLSEARHGLDMFGCEGIQSTLQEYGCLGPDELVQQLFTAASSWATGHLYDDTAIMVIERES